MTGTIAGFTSTGIDDNATSTAITIDASENVGIGTTSPNHGGSGSQHSVLTLKGGGSLGNGVLEVIQDGTSGNNQTLGDIKFFDNTNNNATISAIRDTTTSSGYLTFNTRAPAGSLTETVRMPSTGGITFNGDTAAADALDDYETGTWTPNLVDFSNVALAGVTYGTQLGTYTKVGNTVHVSFYVGITAAATGAVFFYLGGLPYSISTTPYTYYNSFISTQNLATAFNGHFVLEANTPGPKTHIRTQAVNTTTPAGSPGASTYIKNTTWFMGEFSYRV
jgi:hypothetical protein